MSQKDLSATRRDILKLAGGAASFAALGSALPGVAHAAAPMLGVLRPSIYRFKLGSFEVTNILDGFVQGNGPHPTFGNNQPPEAVQAYAKSQGLSPTKMRERLRQHGREHRQGAGAVRCRQRQGQNADRRQAARAAGHRRLQARADRHRRHHPRPSRPHRRTDGRGGKPTYPNARYVFGEVEFDYWKKGENIAEARKANREQFMQVAVPFAEKATFLKGEGEVVVRHPRRPGLRSFAGPHGLPHRERRPAPADLGRRRQPLHHVDPAAGMARRLRP